MKTNIKETRVEIVLDHTEANGLFSGRIVLPALPDAHQNHLLSDVSITTDCYDGGYYGGQLWLQDADDHDITERKTLDRGDKTSIQLPLTGIQMFGEMVIKLYGDIPTGYMVEGDTMTLRFNYEIV